LTIKKWQRTSERERAREREVLLTIKKWLKVIKHIALEREREREREREVLLTIKK
jgi:hypothetical protein